MADSFHISKVQTGRGFGGDCTALIVAPPGAPAGALEALTRFFNEQGYDALPGYSGLDQHHVLRIRGLEDTQRLQTLLCSTFPEWQNEQPDHPTNDEKPITVAQELCIEPQDAPVVPDYPKFEAALREKSTDLSGLIYSVGNIGLVFSALFGNRDARQWGKLVAPISYTISSALLLLLNQRNGPARTIHEIVDAVGQSMVEGGVMEHNGAHDPETKEGITQITEQVMDFLHAHPWEVSSLINMVGAGSHIGSSIRHSQHKEAVAAFGSLTAASIAAFVPEKGGRSLLPINFADHFRRPDGTGLFSTIRTILDDIPVIRPILHVGQQITDWIRLRPLRAAAAIQLASNSGYAISAITKQDEQGNYTPDWALLGTSGAYLTGNLTQAISSKGTGPGFDDVVTNAAAFLSETTDLKTNEKTALKKQIRQLAKALAKQPEIVQSEQRIAQGIEQRLLREDGSLNIDAPIDYLDSFIPMEKQILMESPFISPRTVERAMPQPDEGTDILTTSEDEQTAVAMFAHPS